MNTEPLLQCPRIEFSNSPQTEIPKTYADKQSGRLLAGFSCRYSTDTKITAILCTENLIMAIFHWKRAFSSSKQFNK